MNRFRALSSAALLAGATFGLAMTPASAATAAKAKPAAAKHVKHAKTTKVAKYTTTKRTTKG